MHTPRTPHHPRDVYAMSPSNLPPPRMAIATSSGYLGLTDANCEAGCPQGRTGSGLRSSQCRSYGLGTRFGQGLWRDARGDAPIADRSAAIPLGCSCGCSCSCGREAGARLSPPRNPPSASPRRIAQERAGARGGHGGRFVRRVVVDPLALAAVSVSTAATGHFASHLPCCNPSNRTWDIATTAQGGHFPGGPCGVVCAGGLAAAGATPGTRWGGSFPRGGFPCGRR